MVHVIKCKNCKHSEYIFDELYCKLTEERTRQRIVCGDYEEVI